jgi:Yip1 domain
MSQDSGPAAAAANGTGFFGILINLFVAPSEAFATIVKRPTVLLPLVIIMALNAGFTVWWLQRVDPIAFMKAQMQASGQWDKMPAEGREEMLENQAKFFNYFASIGPIVAPIITLIFAGVLMFVFRFFYAGEVSFRQSLAITAWSSVAVSLVVIPLLALVIHLKDDFTINPQEALQANPTLFVEKDSVPKPLYSFLSSLDLFSFWTMGLLAVGFGVACRKKASSTIWGVATPWLIYVVCKSALAAVF